jgi:hypothetical protein
MAKSKCNLLTEADGRALAIDMLRMLDGYQTTNDENALWPWSVAAMYRPEGTQQDNVVLRYLDAIQQQGSRGALAGFCAVVTDYLGYVGEVGPGTPFMHVYERLTDRDITGRPGPWPTMDA